MAYQKIDNCPELTVASVKKTTLPTNGSIWKKIRALFFRSRTKKTILHHTRYDSNPYRSDTLETLQSKAMIFNRRF